MLMNTILIEIIIKTEINNIFLISLRRFMNNFKNVLIFILKNKNQAIYIVIQILTQNKIFYRENEYNCIINLYDQLFYF